MFKTTGKSLRSVRDFCVLVGAFIDRESLGDLLPREPGNLYFRVIFLPEKAACTVKT